MIELKFKNIYDINNDLSLGEMLLYNEMLNKIGAINFHEGDTAIIVTQVTNRHIDLKDYQLVTNFIFASNMDIEIYEGDNKHDCEEFDDRLKIKVKFKQDTTMGKDIFFAKLYNNKN